MRGHQNIENSLLEDW